MLKVLVENGMRYIILLFLLVQSPLLNSQDLNPKPFTVDINDVCLSEALTLLYREHELNLTFSIDPNDDTERFSFSVTNVTAFQLLTELLMNTPYEFKAMGSQIVVYRNDSKQKLTNKPPLLKNENFVHETFAPQRVFQTDTIIRIDTLIRIDTIRSIDTVTLVKRDTVIVFQDREVNRSRKPKQLRKDMFDHGAYRANGLALHLFAGNLLPVLSYEPINEPIEPLAILWNQSETTSLRSQTAGLHLLYKQNKLQIGTSLALTNLTNRFRYERMLNTGGNYAADTLDIYYSISGTDTTSMYVIDSTYVPLDQKRNSHLDFNRFGYLDWHILLSYDLLSINSADFFITAGMGVSFLVYAHGTAINSEDYFETYPIKQMELTKINFSYQIGFGSRIFLTDRIDLVPQVYYTKYNGTVFKNYPVNRFYKAYGIRLGLFYHL